MEDVRLSEVEKEDWKENKKVKRKWRESEIRQGAL
jgi:hypothetical protein